MSQDAPAVIPGVKNKAIKAIVIVGLGVVVGQISYALFDKFVMKKFNIA